MEVGLAFINSYVVVDIAVVVGWVLVVALDGDSGAGWLVDWVVVGLVKV